MDTVGQLAALEALDLDHTKVTDAGIAKLTGLTRLLNLELDSVELTDAGVAQLGALRSLKELDLYHTLVSEKAFQQLQTTLPACHIQYDRDSTRRERRS
jgi:formyltetrahydrofolate synthetase